MGGYTLGVQQAINDRAYRQNRKDELTDEARLQKRNDLNAARNSLIEKTRYFKGLDENGNEIILPQFKNQNDKTLAQIGKLQYELEQLDNPTHSPGLLDRFLHGGIQKVQSIATPKDKTPSSITTQTPAMTLNTPAAPLTTPELPAYRQAASALPSQGGKSTQVPGVASTTLPGMSSVPKGATPTIPAGAPVTVKKAPPVPWGKAQILKQQVAAMQKAQQDAQLLAAGAGLSPEQQAVLQANAANAGSIATIQGQIKNYKTLNPTANDEDVTAYASSLLPGNNQIGNWEVMEGTINGQSYPLSYDKKKALYKLPDGSFSSTRPENWKADPKASGATSEELQEYASDADPNKGTFPEWMAAKRAKGAAAGKPQNRDDRYISIEQKKTLGQPLTADENAYITAYDLWDKKTKIDPGVARAAAFGAMRYIPVVSPTDPENVVMMRAGDAAKAGVNTPASIGFKTDAAITRYMTSGAGGTNINYFNTATDHLRLLAEAGEALNNGNIQLFNSAANRFAAATGDPAPSNFETVKAAVAGELSKTFKGTGATDSEIADINQTINQAQSPQQIQGAITYYTRLMGSKIQALKSQYDAARSGQPNFPGGAGSPTSTSNKKKVSLARAKTLARYKGKTDAQITTDLKNKNYEVLP